MKPKILIPYGRIRNTYIEAVNLSGGTPVGKELPTYCDCYDGLLLCGGNDVHPKFYNEEITFSKNPDVPRDICELKLIDEFVKAKKPIFGICRGHQILNIFFGGTIIQDLPTKEEHDTKETPLRNIIVSKKGSIIDKLYKDEFYTNSYHHQAVKNVGKEMIITGRCKNDNVIEATEHINLPVFSVQWHPEIMLNPEENDNLSNGLLIFKYFINLCKNK